MFRLLIDLCTWVLDLRSNFPHFLWIAFVLSTIFNIIYFRLFSEIQRIGEREYLNSITDFQLNDDYVAVLMGTQLQLHSVSITLKQNTVFEIQLIIKHQFKAHRIRYRRKRINFISISRSKRRKNNKFCDFKRVFNNGNWCM